MSTTQERREKRAEELTPRRQDRTPNVALDLTQQLGDMIRKVGDIYWDVSEMKVLAWFILEKTIDLDRNKAPLDENTRKKLIAWLDNLEEIRKEVYDKYKGWLSTFIDEDYLEGRKPAPNSDLVNTALYMLEKLENLREQIREFKREVEESRAGDIDNDVSVILYHLARDVENDVSVIILLLLPELTYHYLMWLLQK